MVTFLPFVATTAQQDDQRRQNGRKGRGQQQHQARGQQDRQGAQQAPMLPTAFTPSMFKRGGGDQQQQRDYGQQQPRRSMPAGNGEEPTLYHALIPGQQLPHVTLPTVQGGLLELGAPTGKWQMVVVYRGRHCPVSKNYLASLQQIYYELDELGVEVVAVSGDPRERAESFVDALRATTETKDVSFKIAYDLPLEEMIRWGLFISAPRNTRETDKPFPEPAMFVITPDGLLHIIDYSNSPFARLDLRILIEGIRYIQENDYPIRGTWGLSEYSHPFDY